MPQFVNKLDELLADVVLANNISRLPAIQIAKQYWNSLTDDMKKSQLSQITSLAELNILNSIGVSKEIRNSFLAVIQKATSQGGHA